MGSHLFFTLGRRCFDDQGFPAPAAGGIAMVQPASLALATGFLEWRSAGRAGGSRAGTVILAVMLAGVASLGLLGDYTYFGHSTAVLMPIPDIYAVIVCGIGGGGLGGAYSRGLIYGLKHMGKAFGGKIGRHPVLFAAACGLLLAILGGLAGRDIFGTGYGRARLLLQGVDSSFHEFGVLKLLATLLSTVSGVPGGIFAPSLATGAGIGAELHWILPVAPLATMALLGMVGYFSGVVQSPLTAFVIVMEMTNSHDIVIPLIATSVLAYSVSRLICARPLYHSLSQTFVKQERDSRMGRKAA